MCFNKTFILFVLLVLFHIEFAKSRDEPYGVTIKNAIHFPYGGPFMGIFVAISIPLELPRTDLFLSYNFEANYNLPENETDYEYPPVVSDRALKAFSISRKRAYEALEFNMKSQGYPGKACMLRTICEAAEKRMDHNGVLGEILHILFSPSTSKSEGLSNEYEKAERTGKERGSCTKYYKKCPVSFLDIISWLENI